MMYFTSDLHLYHKNILNFCRETRPYADLTEMRHKLIDEINATCQANDTLYHLGDLYFGKSQDELRIILSEIKCRIQSNCYFTADSRRDRSTTSTARRVNWT